MNEQSRVLLSALIGAAAGATLGWMYTTESGRRFRLEAEPRLDQFRNELVRLRRTVRKASAVASESWDSINELVGERSGAGFGSGLPHR